MAKAVRKPVGNFFIKKSLQLRLIVNVLAVSVVSSVVSAGTLFLVYRYMFNTTVLYIFDHNTNNLQPDKSIAELVLPTLIISSVVGLILAFGIGLYASRKYAVPVFKIEQWASQLLNGDLTSVLKFREQEEMRDLSKKCNELGAMFREIMVDIQKDVKALRDAGVKGPELEAIAEKLGRLELERAAEKNG